MEHSRPTCHEQSRYFTQQIVQEVVQLIMNSFQQQLKVNSLVKYLPQFNTANLHLQNQQCVAYFYLIGQSQSSKVPISRDQMPKNIPKDGMSQINHYNMKQTINSRLLCKTDQKDNNQSITFPIKIEDNNSLSYSMSKSQFHNNSSRYLNYQINAQEDTYKVKEFRETIYKKSLQVKTSSKLNQLQSTNELIPLQIDPPKQPYDPILQTELDHMKKNLYQKRRYRRISIQQQRANIDQMNRKKSHIFVKKSDHTYDYDGSMITGKNNLHKKDYLEFITQLKPTLINHGKQINKLLFNNSKERRTNSLNKSHDFALDNQVRLNFNQNVTNNNPERKLTSQQKHIKSSYSNGNQRQVSHLPFIRLKDNIKIIQNAKQLSGSQTERNSLNKSKFSLSNHDNTRFRSFSQIQLEKRLEKSKQKVLDLNQSSNVLLQIDILPPTLNQNINGGESFRKQSKMMQKYLRKLTEEKTKIQKMIQKDNGLKHLNFEQVTIPQRYPIQRYYEYDYEGEKRSHQYSIASKVSTKINSLSVMNETQPNC